MTDTIDVTIKLPKSILVCDGKRYEPTGEFRNPKADEPFINLNGDVEIAMRDFYGSMRIILRRVKPKIPPKPEFELWTNGGDMFGWYLPGKGPSTTYWRRVTAEELSHLEST